LEVLWQPGPHPSAALAEPMPETRAKTATIKTIFISLFSLDTQAATLGQSWMFLFVFLALPSRILSEICDVLKTAFTDHSDHGRRYRSRDQK
jgi:hypothetical protein